MKKNHFDYIICGGGASGLLLAYRLCNDSFFSHKSILLIEKDLKNTNDRTWCFWESEKGDLEEVVFKVWDHAHFNANGFEVDFSLHPFQYKMIRSIDFYNWMKKQLPAFEQLTQVREKVVNIHENKVLTEKNNYTASTVFSSIFDPKTLYQQSKYPVLLQHFVGQTIKTKKPCFDTGKIQFMNFSVPQKGNTRFMYVLPLSPDKALVEYTLFSENTLEKDEYLHAIKSFVEDWSTGGYEILEEEAGKIPMSCYRFELNNTPTLLHIGTAGGWTKPSTGYTFHRINEKTKTLVEFLKKGQPLSGFGKRNRFWFYDLLFIDVLAKDNAQGADLFRRMFQKNTPEVIFKFLDEKSTLWEEFQIMRSFRVGQFVRALWNRMF